MNIMFTGPFKTDTSWGTAARLYAKALQTQNIGLRLVDFHMGGPKKKSWGDMESLTKNMESYDALIEMALPHYLYKDHRFDKNVAITMIESIPAKGSKAVNNFSIMDKVMFPSERELECPINNAKCIGIPIDTSIFHQEYGDISNNIRRNNDTFVFYTICDGNARKNLEGLIKAYFTEFHFSDNVNLLIKTTNDIDSIISYVKHTFRNRAEGSYPTISIIYDKIDDFGINELHENCDCYVNTSFGESWCMPAADALVFGNFLIYPVLSGIHTYAKNIELAFGFAAYENFCSITDTISPILYCGDERWCEPNLTALSRSMRKTYGLRKTRLDIGSNRFEELSRYSFEEVGKRMVKCLDY